MASIHAYAPEPRRIFSRIGLAFAIAYAVVVGVDYFVQFTVVIPSLQAGETEGLSLFTQYNPHGLFIAGEALGYLAMSARAPVRRTGLRRRPDRARDPLAVRRRLRAGRRGIRRLLARRRRPRRLRGGRPLDQLDRAHRLGCAAGRRVPASLPVVGSPSRGGCSRAPRADVASGLPAVVILPTVACVARIGFGSRVRNGPFVGARRGRGHRCGRHRPRCCVAPATASRRHQPLEALPSARSSPAVQAGRTPGEGALWHWRPTGGSVQLGAWANLLDGACRPAKPRVVRGGRRGGTSDREIRRAHPVRSRAERALGRDARVGPAATTGRRVAPVARAVRPGRPGHARLPRRPARRAPAPHRATLPGSSRAGLLRQADQLPARSTRRSTAWPAASDAWGCAPASGSRSSCRTARSSSRASTPSGAPAASPSPSTPAPRVRSSRGSSPTPAPRPRSSSTASGWASGTCAFPRRCGISSWPMSPTTCRCRCASAPGSRDAAARRRAIHRDGRAASSRFGELVRDGDAQAVPPAGRPRRPGGPPLHRRHDRAAEGRGPDPSQPRRQRLPARRLGVEPRRRRRGHAVGPAARPRLRHDGLHERLGAARLDAGPRPRSARPRAAAGRDRAVAGHGVPGRADPLRGDLRPPDVASGRRDLRSIEACISGAADPAGRRSRPSSSG